MSNSLQFAENVAEAPKDPAQNPKVMIFTALLTAITTIAVSFVGVVPTLRRGDTEAIEGLQQKITNIEKTQSAGNNSISQDPKLTVHGKVTSKDGKRSLNGFDVYFLPEGNNLLTAKTDDSGKFYKEMPAGTYSIIVREANNGMSAKGMLFEDENEVNMDKLLGARVNYRINRR